MPSRDKRATGTRSSASSLARVSSVLCTNESDAKQDWMMNEWMNLPAVTKLKIPAQVNYNRGSRERVNAKTKYSCCYPNCDYEIGRVPSPGLVHENLIIGHRYCEFLSFWIYKQLRNMNWNLKNRWQFVFHNFILFVMPVRVRLMKKTPCLLVIFREDNLILAWYAILLPMSKDHQIA